MQDLGGERPAAAPANRAPAHEHSAAGAAAPESSPQYVHTLTAQAAQASAEQRARSKSVDAPWANVYTPAPNGASFSTAPAPLQNLAGVNVMGQGRDVLALGADSGAKMGSGFSFIKAEHTAAVSPKVRPDFAYRPDGGADLESSDSVSFYQTVKHVSPDVPFSPVGGGDDLSNNFSEELMASLHYSQLNQALQHIFDPVNFTATPSAETVQQEARSVIEQAGLSSFASMVGAAGLMQPTNTTDCAAGGVADSAASGGAAIAAASAAASAAGSTAGGAADSTTDSRVAAAALSQMALGLKAQGLPAAGTPSTGLADLSRAELTRGIANLEHSMTVLLSMLGCGVMIHAMGANFQRKIVWANDAMYQIYGYSPSEFDRLTSDATMPQIIHPADINIFFANFERVHDVTQTIHFEYRILNGTTKHYVWCDMRSAYIGRLGNMSLFICLVRDITADKHQKDRNERWIRKSALLSEACQELVFEYDYNTDTFERFGNYQNFVRSDERVQHNFLQNLPRKENLHPDDKHYLSALLRDTSLAASNKRRTVKFRLRPLNGTEFLWHMCSAIGYTEESTGHIKIIGKVANIHNYETKLATLHQENQRDPMTKLFNKVAMEQLSSQVLKDKTNQRHALLMIDIDNFKRVNDTYGHAFGDEVITMIAQSLAHTFRSSDLVARVGGDEFAVLLQNVTFDQAVALGKMYQRIVGEQSANLSQSYHITSSVGLAFCPDDANNYSTLYHAADQALYWVKTHCKGAIALYSNAQEATISPGLTPDFAAVPAHLRPHTTPSLTPIEPVQCPALAPKPTLDAPPFKSISAADLAAAVALAGVTPTHLRHEEERLQHSLKAIAAECQH